MPCIEFMELESIWKKRYERANYVAQGGLFAVSEANVPNAITLRLYRAKQAQAALAMLKHRKACPLCTIDENETSYAPFESLAS
jgi:hypothetical protein